MQFPTLKRSVTEFGCLLVALVVSLVLAGMAISSPAQTPSAKNAASAQAVYNEAGQALQQGDLVRARAGFEKFVKLSPKSPEGHNSLGWVLLVAGETDAAAEQFRTAIELRPGFQQAHTNLADALAAKKDLVGAGSANRSEVRPERRGSAPDAGSNS